MKINKKAFSVLIINFILLTAVSNIFAQEKKPVQPEDTLRYKKNPIYERQMEMFDLYKTRQADIVMFGNSLTAGADWSELLGRSNVATRGIPSDILEGFNARLNTVLKLKPKIVFVMGGLNDIYAWIPIEKIYTEYINLLTTLKVRGIIPVIELTTYAAKNYAKEWGGTPQVNAGRNLEVDKLNNMLINFAKENNIEVINLLPSIVGKDGYLKPQLTWDGVHFNAAGYRIWAREVENVLRKHKM